MDIADYDRLVRSEYRRLYPDLTGVHVSQVVRKVLGGDLLVVRSDNTVEHEEIAYLKDGDKLKVFRTTEELVQFLQDNTRTSLLRRWFTTQTIGIVIFVLIILAIIGFGLSGLSSQAVVIAALGGVLPTIATYLFAIKGET